MKNPQYLYMLETINTIVRKAMENKHKNLFGTFETLVLKLADRLRSKNAEQPELGVGYEIAGAGVYGPPVQINRTLTIRPFVSNNGAVKRREILVSYKYEPTKHKPTDIFKTDGSQMPARPQIPEMEQCLMDDVKRATGLGFYIDNGFFVFSDQIKLYKKTFEKTLADFYARVEKAKNIFQKNFKAKSLREFHKLYS